MVPSSPADANARCVDVLACFFRDDQKRNGRECCVKVACIHFVGELKYKTFPYNDLRVIGSSPISGDYVL